MLTAARPLALAVTLFALTPLAAAAPDGADKPPLRSSIPPHLDAPPRSATPARVVEPRRTAERRAVDAKSKVNINTADVKGLMTLTGVSRKLAEKIVAHRDGRGAFKKAEDIRKVEGVGNGVWEKNRQRIVVR